MFFTNLAAMLESAGGKTKLNILVSPTTDNKQLSLVIIPQVEGDKAPESALTRPLTIVATPQELDEQFTEVFGEYASARSTLAEQIAAEVTILKADTDASAKRASEKLGNKKNPTKAVKTAPAASCDAGGCDDEGGGESDDEGESSASSTSAPVASTPVAAPAAAGDGLNLFG